MRVINFITAGWIASRAHPTPSTEKLGVLIFVYGKEF